MSEETREKVTLSIDDVEITVPAGTLVIRAAELLGIEIPRFCDHPLLDPVGACRQCLVEVDGRPKPMTACTTVAADGMAVRTRLTSPLAAAAQRDVMELLLINHPLDCPVCDKGGECPLQNQAMSSGRGESRFEGRKRTFPKPIALSGQLLLDRERCVQCARCTRFADQIAGDPALRLMERGASQEVGVTGRRPFDSYFSGNVVQICPVGALTAVAYRFRSRPFGLMSAPTVCEHCASGCALRTDWRNGTVVRRMAGDDPQVNEEWNCDKGRWAFRYAEAGDRLNHPRIRDGRTGEQQASSWPAALRAAGSGLSERGGRAAVLTGGRLTLEDAYAYAKFARVVLGTNDVDFRARPVSAEESGFLRAWVAGRDLGPTYEDLEHAPIVLLAGLEPEEESPMIFLRLRKGARRRDVAVFSIAPFATRGLEGMYGRLLPAAPGTEPYVLTTLSESPDGTGDARTAVGAAGLRAEAPAGSGEACAVGLGAGALGGSGGAFAEAARLLRRPGAVILAGERLAATPGGLSAVTLLAERTGAMLGWVPRRAGDRSALEAGAFPGLLPGGRPVADRLARAEVAAAWDVPPLPSSPGRDTDEILAAAADGRIDTLVIGGVDIDDLRDPRAALRAIERVPFVVSLELRRSAVSERADVVFPVAAVAEKAGTFVDWEGRHRPFDAVLRETRSMPDLRVLNAIAAEMGVRLGLPGLAAARRELAELGAWTGGRPAFARVTPPAGPPRLLAGEAVLASWRMLLDNGRLQDGEETLAGAARRPVARLCATTAEEIGATEGEPLTVGTDRGTVTLPLEVTEMPERVVWIPAHVGDRAVHRELGVIAGERVRVTPATAPAPVPASRP